MLKINYSTAKTIIRIFRLEKRIEKKANNVAVKCKVKRKSLNPCDLEEKGPKTDQVKNMEFMLSNIDMKVSECFQSVENNRTNLNKLYSLMNLCIFAPQ